MTKTTVRQPSLRRLLAAFVFLVTLVTGSVAAHADSDSQRSERGVVNINTAQVDELARLPGVGPAKAEAILRTRERLGGFRHVRQIVHVRGIGRATYRRLHEMLTVDGPTTLE